MKHKHHDALWIACRKLAADYRPYGNTERDGPDCSGGCRWFYELADRDGEAIGFDWGGCAAALYLTDEGCFRELLADVKAMHAKLAAINAAEPVPVRR